MAIALMMFVRVFAFDNQMAEASQCETTCLMSNGYYENTASHDGSACWQYSWNPQCGGYCWQFMGLETMCAGYSVYDCTATVCKVWIQEPNFKCSYDWTELPDSIPR